jgi:hypothetical protein
LCFIIIILISSGNWYKFFIDIDHNLLLWLALGTECRIYDFGTNKSVSKTIYKGLPILEYCLNKYWLNYEMKKVLIGRNPTNQKQYVENEIYKKYFEFHNEKTLDTKIQITTKFKYYRKFLNCSRIKLTGVSKATSHDSDTNFYKNILNQTLD